MNFWIGSALPGQTEDDLFWDSCIVARYLTRNPPELLADVEAFIAEMRAGKRQIWLSSILLAEIRPSMTTGDIRGLHRALESEFNLVGPTPDIMKRAARLRDHSFMHHTPQATEKKRVMSVPDAIQLATCLHIKEARGRSAIRFQTFDDGKTKNYEEKCVSLLRLEEYAKHLMEDQDVRAACELIREKPIHVAPQLLV